MRIISWCRDNSILIGIIILAFLFRIYRLDFQSLWADEIFTLTNSSSDKSFGEIFQLLKVDVHPPLYYYIIHVFVSIFGDTGYVAKFVSLLFGLSSLITLYYLGKELFNKNVALIATFLMGLNHFHIYYSQEARMYSMLCFTTTLSFLFMTRFIKTPTLKATLLYGFTSALLINTHFYSLFPLCAQCVVLLYYVIKPYNITRLKFFLYCLLAGVITLISFIPSIVILLGTSGLKSFWIPEAGWSIYTSMFIEFMGSEIAVAIAVITILYFLFSIFKEKESVSYKVDPINDKPVFAFNLLFIWIFIVALIPFVLSFVRLPMIVSRYFINLLPPIFLLIAAGASLIRNNTVKVTLLSLFILFSLNDLLFVKQHYTKIIKTQFREASSFVKNNHKNNEKIYSTFAVFYSYYLTEKEGNNVINNSLNQVIDRIISNSEKPESFWYVDINLANTTNPVSPNTQAVLDSLYVIDKSVELHDAFAKHYHTKAGYTPSGEFKKYKPYQQKNGSDINFSFEYVTETGDAVDASGWAYFNGQSMEHAKISIVLINDQNEIVLIPEKVSRPDVTTYFKSEFDLSNSGFKKQILKKDLQPGTYKLSLYVIDSVTMKESLVISDKTITK
jgi:uncharacterized membrane protein